jgi:uncharacterized membrane protein HdeD (DUF308 family)
MIRDYWWMFILLGIVMIIAGVGAAITMYIAAFAVQLLLGWTLVVGGIVYGLYTLLTKRDEGLLYILV